MSIKNCCCGDTAAPVSSSIPMFPVRCLSDICFRWDSSCTSCGSGTIANTPSTFDWLPGMQNTYATISCNPPASWSGGTSFVSMVCRVTVSGGVVTAKRVYTADGKDAYFEWIIYKTVTGPYLNYVTYSAQLVYAKLTTPSKTIELRWQQTGPCAARLVISDPSEGQDGLPLSNAWCSFNATFNEVYQLHFEHTVDSIPTSVSATGVITGVVDFDMCYYKLDSGNFQCSCFACVSTKGLPSLIGRGSSWVAPLDTFSATDNVIFSATYRYLCSAPAPGGSHTPIGGVQGCSTSTAWTQFFYKVDPKQSIVPVTRKQVMRCDMQIDTTPLASGSCPPFSFDCGNRYQLAVFSNKYSFHPFDLHPDFSTNLILGLSSRYGAGRTLCSGAPPREPCNEGINRNYPCSSVPDIWGNNDRCQCFGSSNAIHQCQDNGKILIRSLNTGVESWDISVS
jgi:hypothetical protein